MTSSRLRRHNLCPNILESGLVGCSTLFLEPTSLRGSQWPLGQTRTKRSDLHRVSEDAHWPKLVVEQLTVKKNNSFHQKVKKMKHNVALAMTDTRRGASKEKIYQ